MNTLARLFFVFAVSALGARAAQADVSPTHEVRSTVTGEILACECQVSGSDLACRGCAPREEPKITLVGDAGQYNARWHEIIARLKEEGWRPASLVDLEIRVNSYHFEFVISCKDKPGERRFKQVGLTMPQVSDSMVKVIRNVVHHECESSDLSIWEQAYFGSFGDRRSKIRVSPGDGSQYWQQMLHHLFADETIANGVDELVLDPFPVTENPTGIAFYRAEIRLIRCANGHIKPYRGPTTSNKSLERADFRRWVRDRIVVACKL